MPEKACTACGRTLPLEGFSAHKLGRFGRRPRCRSCEKTYNDAWRDENRERCRAVNRDYRHAHPEERAADQRRRRAENPAEQDERVVRSRRLYPEKHRARKLLSRALEAGKVSKPDCCPRCGAEDRPIHGHHTDYSRPLEVEWLCSRCHGAEHRADMPEAA